MNAETLLILLLGTLAMLILMLIIGIKYRMNLWKCIPVAVVLTIVGTIGTYLMYFVENASFEGSPYFGAVFFVPIVFIVFSKLIKIPYGDLLDLCAPAECIMLVLMKYQCLINGCCSGRMLYLTPEGVAVMFPSQLVELINAVVLMLVLMVMALSQKWRGKIYPWYLIIYGCTRFVLNWFRFTSPLLMGLPAGNLWSLVAIFIGVLWLTDRKIVIVKKKFLQE